MFVFGGATAGAQDLGERQTVVYYGDLDVTKPQGAQTLYTRIAIASAEVCGYRPANNDIYALRTFKACSDAAEDRAASAADDRLCAFGINDAHQRPIACKGNR